MAVAPEFRVHVTPSLSRNFSTAASNSVGPGRFPRVSLRNTVLRIDNSPTFSSDIHRARSPRVRLGNRAIFYKIFEAYENANSFRISRCTNDGNPGGHRNCYAGDCARHFYRNRRFRKLKLFVGPNRRLIFDKSCQRRRVSSKNILIKPAALDFANELKRFYF